MLRPSLGLVLTGISPTAPRQGTVASGGESPSHPGLGTTVRTERDPGVRAVGTAVVSLAEGEEKTRNGGEEVRDRDVNKIGQNIRLKKN